MRYALFSTYDKSGIAPVAQKCVDSGLTLLSTGGTADTLIAADFSVHRVSAFTDFPEIMGGRVKTLHPLIHGGLLCRPDREDDLAAQREHGIIPIPIVVVNLYPFSEVAGDPNASEADLIEKIDIGGVAMVRAAAKNFPYVTVITDPSDYQRVIDAMGDQGVVPLTLRRELAQKAYIVTAAYDAAIARNPVLWGAG